MPTQVQRLTIANKDSAALPVLLPSAFEHQLFTDQSLVAWFAARDGLLDDTWLCRKSNNTLNKTVSMPTQSNNTLVMSSVNNALIGDFMPTNSDFTMLVVANHGPSDNAYLVTAGMGAVPSSTNIMYLQHSSNGSIFINRCQAQATHPTLIVSGLCLITVRYSALNKTLKIRVNQSTDTTASANTTAINNSKFVVGGLKSSTGTIGGGIDGGNFAELMIFNRDLSSSDVDNIESYLADKYSIGV